MQATLKDLLSISKHFDSVK